MIEKGNFKYKKPIVDKYSSMYNLSVSSKGDNFWKTYNDLIISAVKKNRNKDHKGIIIPQGNLRVIFEQNGTMKISEKFDVYIF